MAAEEQAAAIEVAAKQVDGNKNNKDYHNHDSCNHSRAQAVLSSCTHFRASWWERDSPKMLSYKYLTTGDSSGLAITSGLVD